MRILHLDSGREMRGGQYQVLYLMEGLRAHGVDGLLLAREGCELLERARRQGLPAQPLNPRRMLAQSRRADVVHAHDAASHTLAAVFDRQPLVVSRRVAFPVHTSLPSRWKYLQAHHYIAVSEFVKGRLLEAGIPPAKITVIPDGVPLLPPAEGDEVLSIDFSDPRKGKRLVEEAAQMAGCQIRFTRNLLADLARARALVYLTEEEGLGSGILLAMAAGVPVVASAVGGIPEVIEDGVTGLLTPNNAAAVAAALRRLLDDPAWAATLGARARQVVAERFSTSLIAERHLQLYQRVVEASGGGR